MFQQHIVVQSSSIDMQRNIIIAVIALLVLGLGVWVYVAFFAGNAAITTAPGAPSTGLPVAGQATTPGGTSDTGAPSLSAGMPAPVTIVSPRLIKISSGPVVPGAVVVSKAATASTSAQTTVSFIERQSGNVFSYSASARTLTRTSNKTVPGIQSAAWLPNASLAFVQYLSGSDFSTINTYALPANGSSGFFLPRNLADISVSSTSILTLASGVNGSIVSTERTDGTHASQLFTTPLSSIRVSFAGKNQYLVYTKPSSSLAGDAFIVDSTGRFSRIAGPLTGLVARASPSGKWVLVSYTVNNAMQMVLINTSTGSSFQLPVATIADKCVWTNNDTAVYCGIPQNPSPANIYPDDWYQGAVSFNDRIWKIDAVGRYAQLVLDFGKETKDILDAEALAIDQLATTLVFVNKNDGSLWSYSL
ncbi:MAG: hypothetical protein WA058_02430 [Minisyncoccia bacterium]